MNHVPIRLGPLALLLTVVSIALAVLAILAFDTARADMALAEQYGRTVQTRYTLEEQGQRFLASAKPGDQASFEADDMRLTVELDDQGRVSRWRMERLWSADDTIGGLWPGD